MELIIRDNPMGSPARSRSPSLGAVSMPTPGRTNRRKITIIDGDFQSSQTELDRAQTPPPCNNGPLSPQRLSSSGSYGDHPRARAMTSPLSDLRGTRRGSTSLTHLDNMRPPSPSLSWRSSTSSIADTSMTSLIHPPSSEQRILKDIKKQMTASFLHSRQLERQVNQIPKLRNDLQALYKEREKLLNELLEQRAIVLQLKQRVSLLHEQNQELAKLAQSDKSSNTQVLAIRNTLVTTMAQLKQMEDQVQTIPSLRSKIRELEDQIQSAKSQALVAAVPSDLPEGVSPNEYVKLVEENSKLKEANSHLMDEMRMVSKHLTAVSESCEGLQSRMEMFQASQNITGPLNDKIKRLEDEKSSLYQELVDARYRHGNAPVGGDLDMAHYKKEVRSLKKANSRLRSKIEHMKMESRTQKEQLVLKLFEIESLNVKTSKYEIEKQLLELEQVQVHSEGPSPSSPSAAAAGTGEDSLREISPDGRALILRFQQLEVHSHEMQNVIKTFVSERQEMEARIVELTAQLNQTGMDELQSQLEESDSKLVLAREKIRSLEETLVRRSLSPEQVTVENERDSYREQVAEMKTEIRRLSAIERQSVFRSSQTDELVETRAKLDKTKGEKERMSRKFKESRSRLKTLASELASSAELVKRYQEQCGQMEQEMERTNKEMESLREELAKAKASLELSHMESTLQKESEEIDNGTNNNTSEVIDDLKSQIGALENQISSLIRDKEELSKERDEKLSVYEKEVSELKEQNKTLTLTNSSLDAKINELESSLQDSSHYKTELENLSRVLSEKTKALNESEYQLNELTTTHGTLVKEREKLLESNKKLTSKITTLSTTKDTLQQKVDLLSQEAPSLVQKSTELQVAKDEIQRKLDQSIIEVESATKRVELLEGELKTSEDLCKELKKKLRLLQSDLDEAESFVDETRTSEERLKKENMSLKEEKKRLENRLTEREKEFEKLESSLQIETEKLKTSQEKCKSLTSTLTAEKTARESTQKELENLSLVEVPKLHLELARTVAEMGQLTTDCSSRMNRIRELETSLQSGEIERVEILKRIESLEKEKAIVENKTSSLKMELGTKTEELKSLQSTHLLAVQHNQKVNEELKKVREELRKLNANHSKKQVETSSLRADVNKLREELKTSQNHTTKLETQLSQKDIECNSLRVKVHEGEILREEYKEKETQCEMLTATRDNLLRRLDKMEKLEMDYELLKHHVQDALGQSSQLRNDNKALLQILHGVENEMPALEKEATRNLQEENVELQQQVSLLSQWNDKHQSTITTLEQQLESVEREKNGLMSELGQIQTLEQSNILLKKELAEVEIEVNRLRRQVLNENDTEIQEEMKVKLETQAQLISIFNEHNKGLQVQVAQLHKQVKHLGGHLERDRPVSPPPMPELSNSLQYISLDARRCSELELLNASLHQQIGRLQAELIAAQDISPIIRRRSSRLLAVSSVTPLPDTKEECPNSVPEDVLLSCSLLADAFTSNRNVPQEQSQSYLQTIAQGWFTLVAHKNMTKDTLKSYLTTFSRLSSKLLAIIVNMQDIRGNSALHHTLANSNFPAVSVLLEIDTCNTNITNRAGYTPLMLAAAHNVDCSGSNKGILQKLMARTDVKIRSKVELQTALMLAVSSGSVDLVSMLLESGSEINAQDKDGSTSLMFACEKGYIEIVQKLLSIASCDVTLQDEDGQTPLDIAESSDHHEIVTLIRNHLKSIKN